jgi:hypothetical protein
MKEIYKPLVLTLLGWGRSVAPHWRCPFASLAAPCSLGRRRNAANQQHCGLPVYACDMCCEWAAIGGNSYARIIQGVLPGGT